MPLHQATTKIQCDSCGCIAEFYGQPPTFIHTDGIYPRDLCLACLAMREAAVDQSIKREHAAMDGRRFWVSWYATHGAFEYHGPWWISGQRMADDAATVCAAVIAADEQAAREIIAAAHDKQVDPSMIEWRFVEIKPADWSPFGERFPRADWMQWS